MHLTKTFVWRNLPSGVIAQNLSGCFFFWKTGLAVELEAETHFFGIKSGLAFAFKAPPYGRQGPGGTHRPTHPIQPKGRLNSKKRGGPGAGARRRTRPPRARRIGRAQPSPT